MSVIKSINGIPSLNVLKVNGITILTFMIKLGIQANNIIVSIIVEVVPTILMDVIATEKLYTIKYLDFSNHRLYESLLKTMSDNTSFISLLEMKLYNCSITDDMIDTLCQSMTFKGPLIREERELDDDDREVATIKIIHSAPITKMYFISKNKHKIIYTNNRNTVCDVYLRFEMIYRKNQYKSNTWF
jgi:hypothetical protein